MNPDEAGSGDALNSDRPIESATQDLLDRTTFAHRLADTISSWRGRESLVIGIYGEWGSGKSSVKNLAIEKLKALGVESPTIVEFNPWMVSGSECIAEAFFKEVGSKIGMDSRDAKGRARAETWKKYVRRLGIASSLAGSVDLALPAFGLPPGVGALLAERIKKVKELAEEAANSLEKEPSSLDDTKRELREQFRQMEKPLLVVVDDIDRLTVEEICLVFRLVKSNGDFPNTIYLLLFQRQTAEEALDNISKGRGKEFLQKIVQVGFDLPTSPAGRIQQILWSELNQLFDGLVDENEWELERWANLWAGGLDGYFRNLREVYRLVNSLAFVAASLAREAVLEVNPVDLIGLECIRVFNVALYESIRESKSWLAPQYRLKLEDLKPVADAFLKSAGADESSTKQILRQLFPNLDQAWGGPQWSDLFVRQWKAQRRLCTHEFFDRYFLLGVPADQVSEATIQAFLKCREDYDALLGILTQLKHAGLILQALDRLSVERSLDEMPDPRFYLLALADISDDLPNTRLGVYGGLFLPGSRLVDLALDRVLGKLAPADRKGLIMYLIGQSTCLSLTGEWIAQAAEPEGDDNFPRLDVATSDGLRKAWLERVRDAGRDGRLSKVVCLVWLLEHWRDWAGPEESRQWVDSIAADCGQILGFLRAQVSAAVSQTVGSAYSRDRSSIPWKNLEAFLPRDRWEGVSRLLGSQVLAGEDLRVKKLLSKSLRRWETGTSDGRPGDFGQDDD